MVELLDLSGLCVWRKVFLKELLQSDIIRLKSERFEEISPSLLL